jgi:hypothetical protein
VVLKLEDLNNLLALAKDSSIETVVYFTFDNFLPLLATVAQISASTPLAHGLPDNTTWSPLQL